MLTGWLTAAEGGTDVASLEAELRATETAFAQTMADRDYAAFQEFLDEDTVFGKTGELRGKASVAEAWKRFFKEPDAPFSWKPEVVTVLPSGELGMSSGPVFDPEGNRIGTFNSVWRRQGDAWKIIFDRGCPPCVGDR
jgi:ketosteroid isomerase-like protein